jgi:proline iminopeptidase
MSTTIQPARYRLRLWRRFSCWGATDDEVAGPYPGAELVPDAKRSPTMAVTIKAPPEQVWPWLVQLGWDRGGWYSWDLLDNAGRQSATRVHPEWQHLAVGDQLQFWAMGRVMDAYRVAVIEPNRFLGLYGYTDLRGRWLDAEQPRPSSTSFPTGEPVWWSAATRHSGPDGWNGSSRHGSSPRSPGPCRLG